MSGFDPDAEREKLINIENQVQEENDEVRELITSIKEKTISVRYGNATFLVPAVVPHEVKEKAFEISRTRQELVDDGASLDEVLEPTFEILAQICYNDPWNKVDTWRQIEMETGASDKIMWHIFGAIQETKETIKKFRGKR